MTDRPGRLDLVTDTTETPTRPPPRTEAPAQKRRSRRRGLLVAIALAALPWAWFLVRDLTPVMDAVAVGLPVMAAGALTLTVLAGAAFRRPLAIPVALSLVIFGVVTTLGPMSPRTGPLPSASVRLVSANVLGSNPSPERAEQTVLAQDADVLAVLENESPMRDLLEGRYPYEADRALLTVMSRYPMRRLTNGGELSKVELLRARIWGPDGPFILYVVHALNPLYEASLDDQLAFVEDLTAKAAQETRPVVLAGDFNMTDRGQGYRRMSEEFRDAMRTGWAEPTYVAGSWRLLFLRIDHVFESREWCAVDAARFDIPGSDHEGISTTVGPCPGRERHGPTTPPQGVIFPSPTTSPTMPPAP